MPKSLKFLLLLASTAAAQVQTGIITGSLSDPAGALIPNGNDTIKSASTGLSQQISSNEAGRFQSPPLNPGEYSVTATAPGFKTANLNLRVEVNQRVSADIKLEVGAATEQITIEAGALQLETETSTLGNIRPSRAVAELPLNARNFATLIFLSAGAVPPLTATPADSPAPPAAASPTPRSTESAPLMTGTAS